MVSAETPAIRPTLVRDALHMLVLRVLSPMSIHRFINTCQESTDILFCYTAAAKINTTLVSPAAKNGVKSVISIFCCSVSEETLI